MTSMPFLLVGLTAAIVACVGLGVLLPWLRRSVMDEVKAWSAHDAPRPRGGGVAILLGIAAALWVAARLGLAVPPWQILVAAALLGIVGLVDDITGHLPILVRLTGQGIAAMLVVLGLGGLRFLPFPAPLDLFVGPGAVPLALLWLVGVTNIYNFLDGLDGYAGTQGLIAGFASAAYFGLDHPAGILGLAIACACAGFLPWNWQPAKVFMGDVSSTTLGFLFASLPFIADEGERSIGLFAVAMFLWFFLSDGAGTLIWRASRGEPFWRPHRSHLYQRLQSAGSSHAGIVARMAVGATVMAAVTIWSLGHRNAGMAFFPLIVAIVLLCSYLAMVRKAEGDAEQA